MNGSLLKKPQKLDAFILCVFLILITFQPLLLHHEIIMLETGTHLPTIQALSQGEVPYKDFLYWRGPLELYVPAAMILSFNHNMIMLPVFYYLFTILTLIIGVLLAYELLRTRFLFYLFVPVFIARTFPRISFYYWGGLRYFIGLLAVYCAVKGFKHQKNSWMLAAGVISALSLLTTIEAGASTIISITLAYFMLFLLNILDRNFILKSFKCYLIGICFTLLPYFIYLVLTGSLIPYLEITFNVATRLTKVMIDAPGNHPESIMEFFFAFIPGTKFFKIITPVYCYIAFGAYFLYRLKKKFLGWDLAALLTVSFYGLILYGASFRMVWGHHFEMALQPEKVVYFFLVEGMFLFLFDRRREWIKNVQTLGTEGIRRMKKMWKVYVINFLIFGLVMSSLGYATARFNRRFVVIPWLKAKMRGEKTDLAFLKGQEKRALNVDRAKGMVVPKWQADEIEAVVNFFEKNTKPSEKIFYYPELGSFSFFTNRLFVGRFPVATASWIHDGWHQELVDSFKKERPEYVIMTKLGHNTFPAEWYFRHLPNREKFNEVTSLILDNYIEARSLTSLSIYKRK